MDTALVQEPPARLGGGRPRVHRARPRCGPQDQGHRGLHAGAARAVLSDREPLVFSEAVVSGHVGAQADGRWCLRVGSKERSETGWQDRTEKEKGREVEKMPGSLPGSTASLPHHRGGESRTGHIQ